MDSRSGRRRVGVAERDQGGGFSYPRWAVIREWLEWLGTGVIFLSFGIILAGLADRRPPFVVLDANVPSGAPGERVVLDLKVWRDVHRGCSMTAYVTIHHSGGVRYSLPPMPLSAAMIENADRKSQGRVRHELDIPSNAVPGADAYFSIQRKYICNDFQAFLPIEVTSIHPFVVRHQ